MAIAQCKLALCAIRAAVVLAHADLFAKICLCFELCKFYDMLELHMLEHAIKLILIELSLEILGDAFDCLCVELFSVVDKLTVVVFMKHDIKSPEHKNV